MDNVTDSIAWPTRDPGWVTKVLVMGLIGLIPILGQIVLYGWMLTALDNMRAGRQELPPAGFSYVSRGINLWVVLLLYGLALAVVVIVLFILGATFAGIGAGQNSGGAAAIGTLFILVAYLALFVAIILLYFLTPPIVVATERGGIAAGLNLPAVIAVAMSRTSTTLVAGLMTLVAYLIGSLGSIVCLIGVILTQPYGLAVLAGVIFHYERAMAAPTAPAT